MTKISDCIEPRNDSFWYHKDTECALGAVLFAHYEDEFLAVKKRGKKDYEFSNMLALPGGMIRHKNDANIGIEISIQTSLVSRFHNETGIKSEMLDSIGPLIQLVQ